MKIDYGWVGNSAGLNSQAAETWMRKRPQTQKPTNCF